MPWELTGNSGTDASTNFLGTIDQQPLVIKAGAAAHGREILRIHPPDNNPSLIGYVSVGSGNAAALLTVTANWDGDGLALIGRPAASLNVGLKFREEGNPADPVAALGLASIPDAWMIGTHRQDVVLYASPGRVCLGSGPYPTHPQVAICNASNSPEHPDPRGGIWLTGGISFTSDLNAGTGEFIRSDRDGTQGNRVGLDFFTGYQPRLSITNGGNIGIGTQTPGATLDVAGDIRVSGDVLLANADCAEDFSTAESSTIEPGTVVVLDDAAMLRESSTSYDIRVAGVVSGAGAFRPAIRLNHDGQTNGRVPVALLGRVMCKADAAAAPIGVGDLLTTGDRPGHAMKVTDPGRALGAIIGKALTPLAAGRGTVLVLVGLG